MSEKIPNKEIHDSTPIAEIVAIENGGLKPETREDLAELVEFPLLEACQELFDKNIQTVFSSANTKDVGGFGYITIDFESLSEENKKIALRIGEVGMIHGFKPKQGIYLNIPITEQSTVGEVKEVAKRLVGQFTQQ